MAKTFKDIEWVSAFLDTQGIFGEVNAVYTSDDILAYWHENKDTDPVLKKYDSIGEWECDTLAFMDEVYLPVV